MPPTTTSAFDLYRAEVEGAMQEHGDLSSVEQALDHSELPDDERDALWLLAWSLDGRQRHAPDGISDPRGQRMLTVVR